METSLPASLSTGSPYDPQVVQPELPQPTNATIPPAAIFGFAEKDAIHLLGCSDRIGGSWQGEQGPECLQSPSRFLDLTS